MCPLSTSKLKIMVIMKELKKVYTYAFAAFVFSEGARFFFFSFIYYTKNIRIFLHAMVQMLRSERPQ